jgi:FSR family fosmidomycin resistance protein-like MFS transporter
MMKTGTRASVAVLVALTLAHLLNHVYTGAISPFLPVITEELSMSLTQAGMITSAATLTMTLAHLAVGYFADRGWGNRFISISVFFGGLFILLAGFVTSFLSLFICMLLLGLGASGFHPCSFPAIAERFPSKKRASALGVQAIGGLIGSALIPGLGVVLLVTFGGWRSSLALIGMAGIILFVPVWILLQRDGIRCDSDVDVETRCNPEGWTTSYYVNILYSWLKGIPFHCTSLLMPLYLVVSYGYEPVWAGSLTALMLGTGLVAEVIAGPVSDRIGKRIPFIISSTGIMAPFLLLLNFALAPIPLALTLMGIGFFHYWGVPPFKAYQTEVSPQRSTGLAFGIIFSIGALPGALSPWIFGAIGDFYGLQASIWFLVITSALATVVGLFMKEIPMTPSADAESVAKAG